MIERRATSIAMAVLMVGLLPAIANGRDCQVELKPTDGYKELSAALKCLKAEIESLKGSGGKSAAAPTSLARPPSASSKDVLNGTFRAELGKCGTSKSGIYCKLHFTNLTKEDKKLCFGQGSRLVTEDGAAYSHATNLYVAVGSRNGYPEICDNVTPLTRVATEITFFNSTNSATGKIQFFRLDCGPGCMFEAYDLPIN